MILGSKYNITISYFYCQFDLVTMALSTRYYPARQTGIRDRFACGNQHVVAQYRAELVGAIYYMVKLSLTPILYGGLYVTF